MSKESRLPYYFSIVESRSGRFIPSSWALTQSEMQTAMSRIWTRLANSISVYDDNRCANSLILGRVHWYHTLILCGSADPSLNNPVIYDKYFSSCSQSELKTPLKNVYITRGFKISLSLPLSHSLSLSLTHTHTHTYIVCNLRTMFFRCFPMNSSSNLYSLWAFF